MSVVSFPFFFGALVLPAVFTVLPGATVRQVSLALLNFLFLYTLVPNHASWVALGFFLLSGYGVALFIQQKNEWLVFALYLAILLSAFAVLKKYQYLDHVLPTSFADHPIAIVGLSYMLFRQIHYIVDVMQAQIARLSLWRYLNYQLSVFTLLSGPIQRYSEFDANWKDLRPLSVGRHELLKTYVRLMGGFFKMAIIGSACFELYQDAVDSPDWHPITRGAVVFYGYPAYVYFNFSGYSSIVIAAGSLLGLKLPENFNRPYLARNMLDFWNRWHMSLSYWLRDYLFMPVYKTLAETWPQRATALAPVCYFGVFLVAGMWHGATSNFVVFGFLHGLGVSAAKFWENTIIKLEGRKGLRRYLESHPVRVFSTATCFHYACATFLFFPDDLRGCLNVIRETFL